MSLAAKADLPVPAKGWLRANRWLLSRRAVQVGVLAIFLLGPWTGLWIVKGNLASSLTLGVLPLTDPFILLQSLAAGHSPHITALIGAAIVLTAYLVVGGRAYCAWVCPINMVTDAAQWLRNALGMRPGRAPPASLRYWILAGALIGAAVTGTLAWELINPVSTFYRGLFFGFGLGVFIILAVFVYDLVVAQRGWCGHVCPMGAFYGLVGHAALLRVSAARRGACNDCADCYAVCPEPLVIKPALKGRGPNETPIITSGACTNCARCLDVCTRDVFRFTTRFDRRSDV